MSEKLELISTIVDSVFALETTPTKAILKIAAVLDSTERDPQ